ncbi:hypothetical protein ACE6ED_26865 [Paenibacillus sp. CN-4]|uniref:hypothetical protein n=1 Tax=Paenibacillus nanchangensis TaxID=3348343 RepID=UPI003979D89B
MVELPLWWIWPCGGIGIAPIWTAVCYLLLLNFRSWKNGIDPWVSKQNPIDLLVFTKNTSLVRDCGNATNHVNKKGT